MSNQCSNNNPEIIQSLKNDLPSSNIFQANANGINHEGEQINPSGSQINVHAQIKWTDRRGYPGCVKSYK